ncbi:hypothetical protein GUITHDRAFT_65961 [Guillardia theta CCMP2712]|uniref:rRNA adenine N(6)-methyltransferase n=1 Tax=Guillardia theta (strain CCMP2712) TaxID=905079 RepID=L1JSS1_GUITC|nr:hypothetical protein GUITHDRAFT_65961 [Guillardia theta CCMP2712]EKX51492.1 hypothetical protein GUITHDRAFT_65961 [Guillardia theta CCMP2712]|eukprot:XP_005838472.1 hypothetical protein GUITHDRAFT_65961 [Guillardia theta CCMP2712]
MQGSDIESESTSKKFKTPSQSASVYKAKQSLGQNFLVDMNVARRIVESLQDKSEDGRSVVEVGPGKGALTAMLLQHYPKMTAIEIDQRSVQYLSGQLPELSVIHSSVLDVDWKELSANRAAGDQISVIGNLPYYIVSQILFSILDAAPHIRRAVLTMQWEVAQRVVSEPRCKPYGILSVVSQLYGTPKIAFKIPPNVFQPQPDVDSALVVIDFPKERPSFGINECNLRTVLRSAFQMRRKMLRQSLKALVTERGIVLPEELGTRRPESLTPHEFIDLTKLIFGEGTTPEGVAVWRGKLDDLARIN